jgi:hypothetical protein
MTYVARDDNCERGWPRRRGRWDDDDDDGGVTDALQRRCQDAVGAASRARRAPPPHTPRCWRSAGRHVEVHDGGATAGKGYGRRRRRGRLRGGTTTHVARDDDCERGWPRRRDAAEAPGRQPRGPSPTRCSGVPRCGGRRVPWPASTPAHPAGVRRRGGRVLLRCQSAAASHVRCRRRRGDAAAAHSSSTVRRRRWSGPARRGAPAGYRYHPGATRITRSVAASHRRGDGRESRLEM